jgi:hypothetical protein
MMNITPELQFKTILLSRDTGGGMSYLRRCADSVREIARARVLLTDCDIPAVAALKLRRETVHLRLPENVYPLTPFGKATLSHIGGYEERFGADLYANVTAAVSPSTHLEKLFTDAYGIPAPALGAPIFDYLRDEDVRKNARQRVCAVVPGAKGKKILLYAPQFRVNAKGKRAAPKRPDFQLFAEYLQDEWFIALYYPPRCGGRYKPPVYYNDFIADFTNKLPLSLLMSAADVCVTDFNEPAYAFAATGRALLPFAADFDDVIPTMELREGWDAALSAPFTGDTGVLIEEIINIKPRDGYEVFDVDGCCRKIAEAIRLI